MPGNAFTAHPEKVLITMLSDKDGNVSQLAVNKVWFLSGNMPGVLFIACSVEGGSDANPDVQLSIRQFVLPELNLRPSFTVNLSTQMPKTLKNVCNKRCQ